MFDILFFLEFNNFDLQLSYDFLEYDGKGWDGFVGSFSSIQYNCYGDTGGLVDISTGDLSITNEAFSEIGIYPVNNGTISITNDSTGNTFNEKAYLYLNKITDSEVIYDTFSFENLSYALSENDIYDENGGSVTGTLPLAIGNIYLEIPKRLPDRSGQPTYHKAYLDGDLAKPIVAITNALGGEINVNVVGHGLNNGDDVTIEGTDDGTSDYNGDYAVNTVVDADNFTVYALYVADVTGQGQIFVSGNWAVYDNGIPIPGNVSDNGDNTFSLSATPVGEIYITGTGLTGRELEDVLGYLLYDKSAPYNGQVRYYSLNHTTFSHNSLLNNLTLYGTTAYDYILYRYALNLSGSGYAANTESISLGTEFSLCTWFYPTSEQTGSSLHFIYGDSSSNIGLFIDYSTSPNEIVFKLSDGVDSQTLSYQIPAYASWYQISGILRNDILYLYVNNVLQDSNSIISALSGQSFSMPDIYIGGDSSGLANIVGRIQDIRIYDRYLLSPEIEEIQRYGISLSPSSTDIFIDHYVSDQIELSNLINNILEYSGFIIRNKSATQGDSFECIQTGVSLTIDAYIDDYDLLDIYGETRPPVSFINSSFYRNIAVLDQTGRYVKRNESDVSFTANENLYGFGNTKQVSSFNFDYENTLTSLTSLYSNIYSKDLLTFSTILSDKTIDINIGDYISVSTDYLPLIDKSLTILSGWDLSTLSFTQDKTLSEASRIFGLTFKPDGTKMYALSEDSNDAVYQYTLSTAWDIDTATYDSIYYSVSSEQTYPTGLFFKPDGYQLFVIGSSPYKIFQYTLSTAWDISTMHYSGIAFNYALYQSNGTGFFFKPDGTKMYIANPGAHKVIQYNLSTAWDIDTATYINDFSLSYTSVAVFFKPDGNKMYIATFSNSRIIQYNLSTAWDVSTASEEYVYIYSCFHYSLFLQPNGVNLYSSYEKVRQFTMSYTEEDTIGVQILGKKVDLNSYKITFDGIKTDLIN